MKEESLREPFKSFLAHDYPEKARRLKRVKMTDELLLTDSEIRKYVGVPDVFLDSHRKLLQAQLAKAKKYYGNRIEEAKVTGLEAGKLLGAKEERERLFKKGDFLLAQYKTFMAYEVAKQFWQALKGEKCQKPESG